MKHPAQIYFHFLWLTAAISLFGPFALSQQRLNNISYVGDPDEKIYLVTDRDLYISGEKVYLKAFCLNRETNKPSAISKVAYLSLLDHTSTPLVQIKIWLTGSSGSGEFLIPDTLQTGCYMISTCTHWMRNFPQENYATKTIKVINPFIKARYTRIPDSKLSGDADPSSSDTARTGIVSGQEPALRCKPSANFTIEADKTILQPREKVSVTINTINNEGIPSGSDLVISVFKSFAYDSLTREGSLKKILSQDESSDLMHIMKPAERLQFLPEPEGHIVSGTICSTITGEPLAAENMMLSFVGKTASCYFAKSDENGVFNFIVDKSGKQEVFIQPFDPDLQDYYIELVNPFPEAFEKYLPERYFIDTSRLDEINSAIISMQLQALFYKKPELAVDHRSQQPDLTFYGDPDHEILLANFIELTSLEEVFKELLPWAPVRTMSGHKRITLLNNVPDEVYLQDPFMLVDGIPLRDHVGVLAIPNTGIERIKIVNSRYFITDMCLDGIIDITTNKGDLSATRLEIPGFRQEFDAPLPGSDFYSPEYLTEDQKSSRIPDCRNTLYWDPDLRTDKNGEATAEFYASDEPGEYLILAEGFTVEGLYGRASLVITVRDCCKGIASWDF